MRVEGLGFIVEGLGLVAGCGVTLVSGVSGCQGVRVGLHPVHIRDGQAPLGPR